MALRPTTDRDRERLQPVGETDGRPGWDERSRLSSELWEVEGALLEAVRLLGDASALFAWREVWNGSPFVPALDRRGETGHRPHC